MRATLLFGLLILLSGMGFSCKEIPKSSPGMVRMVHDMPCQELVPKLLQVLKKENIPWETVDQKAGLMHAGPFLSDPLAGDPYLKMEERVQVEVKCLDALSTRISIHLQLRGLTQSSQWVEINDLSKIEAYQQRFLNTLTVR
jgi:hypothetical protein